jgi:hypothetical protein
VAEGVPVCWQWLGRRSAVAPALLGIALALPVAQTAYRVAVPWPRANFREAVAWVKSRFRDGDLIASDHWEVLYYTRGHEDRLCRPDEIADRRPPRVWVLTGTDPGVGEIRFRQVPPEWRRVAEKRFHGTIAVLYEYHPPRLRPAGPYLDRHTISNITGDGDGQSGRRAAKEEGEAPQETRPEAGRQGDPGGQEVTSFEWQVSN